MSQQVEDNSHQQNVCTCLAPCSCEGCCKPEVALIYDVAITQCTTPDSCMFCLHCSGPKASTYDNFQDPITVWRQAQQDHFWNDGDFTSSRTSPHDSSDLQFGMHSVEFDEYVYLQPIVNSRPSQDIYSNSDFFGASFFYGESNQQ